MSMMYATEKWLLRLLGLSVDEAFTRDRSPALDPVARAPNNAARPCLRGGGDDDAPSFLWWTAGGRAPMSLGLYKKKRNESRAKPGFIEVLTGVESTKLAAERNMEVPRLREKVAELEAEKARWDAVKAGWVTEKAKWEAVKETEGKKVDVEVVLEGGEESEGKGKKKVVHFEVTEKEGG